MSCSQNELFLQNTQKLAENNLKLETTQEDQVRVDALNTT